MTTFTAQIVTLALSTVALAASTSACTASTVEDDVESTAGELVSFVCDEPELTKNDPNAGYGQVVAVRAAGHNGYDRFVMQFAGNGKVPNYHLARQSNATFFMDGSGDPLMLPGNAGLSISVHSASGWDFNTGQPSYTGPQRFTPAGGRLMTEAANTGDFEGYVGWGVGLKRAACYRVVELANPPRLVVDVQNNGPTPVDPPEPPGTDFRCGASAIGRSSSNAPHGQLVGVRASGHPEYDRFVMQFSADSGVPNFDVSLRSDMTFTGSGEDTSFTLPGTASLGVLLHSASSWNFETSQPTYTGPTTITLPGAQNLLQAREYDNFEGYIGWGLGLKQSSCYRAFKLTNPPRLVVDVQH